MGTIIQPSFVGTVNTDGGFNNQQNISCHSDGTLVAAVKDGGQTGSTTNIKIMTSTDQGATWTQRASITAPVAVKRVAIGQRVDGMIHLVALQADELAFRHCTITWGTWAVSAWDQGPQVYAAPNKIGQFDVDVSDGGAVAIAFQMWNGSTQFYLLVYHRTPGGTWARSATDAMWSIGSEARRTPGEDVSIVALNISGGIRTWVIANSVVSSKNDYGVEYSVFRINETTNAVTDLNGSQPGVRGLHVFQGHGVSTSLTSGVKRRVKLFRTGTDEWTSMLFVAPASGTPWLSAMTVNQPPTGTTRTTLSQSMSYIPAAYANQLGPYFSFAIDDNRNCIFRYSVTGSSSATPRIIGDVHYNDGAGGTAYAYGMAYFPATSNVPIIGLSHGSRRNKSLARLAFSMQFWITPTSQGPITSYVETPPNLVGGASAIIAMTPAQDAAQVLGNPQLTATVDTEAQYSQSMYRIEWQFATDPTFTTNLITFRQWIGKAKKVEGTNTAGVTSIFTDTLPSAYNLNKTLWYMRARLVDLFGNAAAWTAATTFSVGHPPRLTPTSPVGGGFYNWNDGERTFSWDFYDPSPTDYQTAFRYVVTDKSNNDAIVFDSGKVPSSAKTDTINFNLSLKDHDLAWSIMGWDADDTEGPWSTEAYFNLTDPTVATFQSPTPDEVLPTGVPTFVFTPSTGGGRAIKEYTLIVTKGANIIWSQRSPSPVASGTQISIKMPQGFLENNTSYSVQVLVVDSSNVTGSSDVRSFSTAWVPPASPTGLTVSSNKYNVEDEGYTLVSWDDAARDPDFTSWALYRKDDLIDDFTGVVMEEGSWELMFRDYSLGALYAYKDFFAPSNHRVTYRVVQSVNRIGQDIDSLPAESGSIVPSSDGYWLIEPTSDNTDADAFKLSIVTGDSFSDDQEEAEFTVIGRGRVVNKGQRLGYKGSLDVQLRNTGGTTARQKRKRLVKMQQESRQLYLRNPFGDIFKVSVSGISVSRIAGVGSAEFCDVSIPYSEVS